MYFSHNSYREIFSVYLKKIVLHLDNELLGKKAYNYVIWLHYIFYYPLFPSLQLYYNVTVQLSILTAQRCISITHCLLNRRHRHDFSPRGMRISE